MGSQNILWTFTQCKTIKLHFYVFFRMVPCTFDWFILTFEYSLTKLPTLKKYNKWCILTCNYKISLILNGLDHSVVAKHNVTSSLLHVTQQLPIQIPPPQRIFFVCEKMKRTRKPWFFYKLFKTRVFFIFIWPDHYLIVRGNKSYTSIKGQQKSDKNWSGCAGSGKSAEIELLG